MLSNYLLLAVGALSAVVIAQSAEVVGNNPVGATYQATFTASSESSISGYVSGSSNANGTGVVFNVNIQNLPDISEGPFLYHIHEYAVPANGNCTGTGAHLDPYGAGESPACDPTNPATCQVGDLAGKYGKMSADPWQKM